MPVLVFSTNAFYAKAELSIEEEGYRFSSARFYKDLGDEFGFLSDYR